jgi:hypothetical protein
MNRQTSTRLQKLESGAAEQNSSISPVELVAVLNRGRTLAARGEIRESTESEAREKGRAIRRLLRG